MDQTRDHILVLGLDRHHIAFRADGNDGLLQVLGLTGGDDFLQNVTHLGLCDTDVAADGGKLRAGRIGQFILTHNGCGDPLFQSPVGGQAVKQVRNDIFLLGSTIFPGVAGRAQHQGNIHQLPGIQAAPHVGSLQTGDHRTHAGKTGTAPQDQHFLGGAGLLQCPLHIIGISHGHQGTAAILALLGHRALSQHGQDLGQFQGHHRFFKQVAHSQPPISRKSLRHKGPYFFSDIFAQNPALGKCRPVRRHRPPH